MPVTPAIIPVSLLKIDAVKVTSAKDSKGILYTGDKAKFELELLASSNRVSGYLIEF